MAPMCAAHVTSKVVAYGVDNATDYSRAQLPWRPISQTSSIKRQPPKPSNLNEEQQKARRDQLAASAQVRYDEWKNKSADEMEKKRAAVSTKAPHSHKFRERHKSKELHGEWASADKVLHEKDRIDRAVTVATAAFLQNPPYPKSGGGVKNVEFSYMSSGYDYRMRQPSKEVSGTWSIMRTKAITESARINEAIAAQRTSDTLGGGRWTIDQRYGNPQTFTPLPTGDTFRQSSPRKWLGTAGGSPHGSGYGSPGARSAPPPTAPGMRGSAKWRGGFATNFPPRTASAVPLSGQMHARQSHGAFADQFHDTVAVHIPESIKHGAPFFRPIRTKEKELTGKEAGVPGSPHFWPQYTGDGLVPNPSASCTWNVTSGLGPPSPVPQRAYLKTAKSPRPGLNEGADLVSASEVQADGGGSQQFSQY